MIKKVLSINHSNATGESGIQSDLAFFHQLNVFGFTVITGINTTLSKQIEIVDDITIKNQLETVFITGQIDAIKITTLNSIKSLNLIKQFIDTYEVKHLIYEVDYSDIKKEMPQTIIRKLSPIIVLTNLANHSTSEIVTFFKGKKLEEINYLFLSSNNQQNLFYLFNGSQFNEFNIPTENLAAFLTAELAINESISHLLTTTK